MPFKTIVASTFEYGLVALGWILIWRLRFSAKAREARKTTPALLAPWKVDGAGFAFAVLCVCLGWLGASIVYGQLQRGFPSIKSDEVLSTIFSGLLSQLGLLSGVAGGLFYIRQTARRLPAIEAPAPSAAAKPNLVRAALSTFAITVAVVWPVQLLWKYILEQCHLPTANQGLVEIFNHTNSPVSIAILTVLAVLLAPLVEECVFRGGLFRFLRGRAPRWIALVLPALVFAALHVNYTNLEGLVSLAPLTAFGIVFSLAYERTGRLAVVMIAHALFNLHTVVFLLLGLDN